MATIDHRTWEALGLRRVLNEVSPKIFRQLEAPCASDLWADICMTIFLNVLTVLYQHAVYPSNILGQ